MMTRTAYCLRSLAVLLAAAAIALLASCAPAPVTPLAGGEPAKGPIVVGTLAPADSYAWRISPAWTRLIVLRQRTTRELQAGRITTAAAKEVLSLTDQARAQLDLGQQHDTAGNRIEAISAQLNAGQSLDRADAALRGGAK